MQASATPAFLRDLADSVEAGNVSAVLVIHVQGDMPMISTSTTEMYTLSMFKQFLGTAVDQVFFRAFAPSKSGIFN